MYRVHFNTVFLTLVFVSILILSCSESVPEQPNIQFDEGANSKQITSQTDGHKNQNHPTPITIPTAAHTNATTDTTQNHPTPIPVPTAAHTNATTDSTRSIPATLGKSLIISCELNVQQQTVICKSNITLRNSTIKWSSNIAGFRHSETYEIRLNKDYQYINEARIELENCDDNQCETVFTIIDTEPARPPDIPRTTANTNSIQNGVGNRFRGCSGSGEVQFEHSPMRFEDFSTIKPYGAVSGAHVTPIDHMYFAMADRSLGRDSYEVKAIQE